MYHSKINLLKIKLSGKVKSFTSSYIVGCFAPLSPFFIYLKNLYYAKQPQQQCTSCINA